MKGNILDTYEISVLQLQANGTRDLCEICTEFIVAQIAELAEKQFVDLRSQILNLMWENILYLYILLDIYSNVYRLYMYIVLKTQVSQGMGYSRLGYFWVQVPQRHRLLLSICQLQAQVTYGTRLLKAQVSYRLRFFKGLGSFQAQVPHRHSFLISIGWIWSQVTYRHRLLMGLGDSLRQRFFIGIGY